MKLSLLYEVTQNWAVSIKQDLQKACSPSLVLDQACQPTSRGAAEDAGGFQSATEKLILSSVQFM